MLICPQPFGDQRVRSCPIHRENKVRNRDQPFTLYMGSIPCMEGQGGPLKTGVVGWGSWWAGVQVVLC